LFSCQHTFLRLQPPPEEAWTTTRSARRALANKAQVSLRISSDDAGKPIWASWVIDMHRPLPDGAIVKWAHVRVVRRGPFYEWYLMLTLDTANVKRIVPEATGNVLAIDVGWRVMDKELRVAAWRDDAGNHGDLRLDAETLRMLREPNEIRSERDMRFDTIRERMCAWLGAYAKGVPDWLRAITKNVEMWKSTERMDRVYIEWHDRGWGKDQPAAAMYDDLSNWYAMNRHLWAREGRRGARAHRRRREIYRIFAAKMSTTYKTIVMEGDKNEDKAFDLTPMVRRPTTEQGAQNETSRTNRVLASISQLRGCLKDAINARCREQVFVVSYNLKRECNECHVVEDRDESDVTDSCSACGSVWDQDDNECRNMLERYKDRPEAPKEEKAKEPTETRWARAARMRKEKVKRMASREMSASSDAE
jgi:hypothetical protein